MKLKDIKDNIKWTNIHIIGVPNREKEAENLFEQIMLENFLNFIGKKKKKSQIQKAQGLPNKINPNKHKTVHITNIT